MQEKEKTTGLVLKESHLAVVLGSLLFEGAIPKYIFGKSNFAKKSS